MATTLKQTLDQYNEAVDAGTTLQKSPADNIIDAANRFRRSVNNLPGQPVRVGEIPEGTAPEQFAPIIGRINDHRDNIHDGVKTATAAGFNPNNTLVEDNLGSAETAGQYDGNNTKADSGRLGSKHLGDIVVHELNHEKNDKAAKARGEGQIREVAFNEGLTIAKTAKDTGNEKVGYNGQYDHVPATVAAATGTTVNNLLQLYKTGQNNELNAIYDQYEQAS